jgi:YVTN family beta-propeller protein
MRNSITGSMIRCSIVLCTSAFLVSAQRAGAAPYAYVPNKIDFTVSIIDIATNTVVGTPAIGVEFDEPTALAVTPNASRVYIVGDSPDGPVSIIDTSTNMATPRKFTLGDQLKAVAIPSNRLGYFATAGAVEAIDIANETDIGPVVFEGNGPASLRRMTTSQDRTRIYLTDSGIDGLWLIDTSANTASLLDTFTHECAISTVSGPCVTDDDCPSGFCKEESVLSSPLGVTATADGRYAYVANHASRDITVIDTIAKHCQLGDKKGAACSASPDAASPDCPGPAGACRGGLCPCTNVVTSITPNEFANNAVALAPDGRHIYAAGDAGTISVIDTATNTVSGMIPIDEAGQLFDIAVAPDGDHLYAVDVTSEVVWVVASSSQAVVTSIQVGSEPVAIAIAVAQPSQPCAGDCDGDNQVAVNELVTMVNIALGSNAVQCSAGDTDHDSMIAISELVAAVNRALTGCA